MKVEIKRGCLRKVRYYFERETKICFIFQLDSATKYTDHDLILSESGHVTVISKTNERTLGSAKTKKATFTRIHHGPGEWAISIIWHKYGFEVIGVKRRS